jgi:hypothetical protein
MLATIYKFVPAITIGLIVGSKILASASALLATLPK